MNRWRSFAAGLLMAFSHVSSFAQTPTPPPVIHVFQLKSISAHSLESTLKQLFSTEITLAADQTTNSLIVRGTAEQLAEVKNLVTLVDRPREATATSPAALSRGTTVNELQRQYRNQEERAADLARRIRQAAPDEARGLRDQLQDAVGQAFRLRQQIHRAELSALEQQMRRVSQTLEVRERLQDPIVERRVQDLLNPESRWENAETVVIDNDLLRAPKLNSESRREHTAPPTPEAIKLAEVLEEQIESLEALFLHGKATLPELLQCHRDLLQARLDMAQDAAARLAARQAAVDWLTALQRVVSEKFNAGLESQASRLAVEAALLKAQRDLAAEAKPPARAAGVLAPATTSLLNAVRHFNETTATHPLSDGQPPLTDDEVVASVLWTTASEDIDGLDPGEFAAFRRIGEERVLPTGWELGLLTERRDSDELHFQLWSIYLTLERPGGSNFTHVIREQVLRQLTADGEPMELPPAKAAADSGKGTPLAAAVKGFNSEHHSLDGQEQPPLTEEEVVAAIRAWQAKRNDAPVTNAEFAAFQRIADERLIPENSRFEMIGSFGREDGSVCYIWSVRIVMPQTAKPGWTYAFTIRERFLRLRQIDDSQISWGPVGANGLQVGVRLDPHNAEYTSGQHVGTHFFFRNAGRQSLDMAFPRLLTRGYYKALHVFDASGKAIPIDQDPGPGGPVGWIQMPLDPGDQYDLRGGTIVFGIVPRAEGVETVIQAEAGQAGRLSFTIPNYTDPQGPELSTGQVDFLVSRSAVDAP